MGNVAAAFLGLNQGTEAEKASRRSIEFNGVSPRGHFLLALAACGPSFEPNFSTLRKYREGHKNSLMIASPAAAQHHLTALGEFACRRRRDSGGFLHSLPDRFRVKTNSLAGSRFAVSPCACLSDLYNAVRIGKPTAMVNQRNVQSMFEVYPTRTARLGRCGR